MLGSVWILRKVFSVWTEWLTWVTDALSAWFAPGWCTKRTPAKTVIKEIIIIIIIIIIISNDNRTEWNPIRSVIIWVINKIGLPAKTGFVQSNPWMAGHFVRSFRAKIPARTGISVWQNIFTRNFRSRVLQPMKPQFPQPQFAYHGTCLCTSYFTGIPAKSGEVPDEIFFSISSF